MWTKLKHLITNLFTKSKPKRTQPTVAKGDKVGGVTIQSQAQLDKHTPFKPGETYMLGECIVTVHASKESMLKAIAKVDARRAAREARLIKRAEDIMLMSPEQLEQFKVADWLKARSKKESWLSKWFNRSKRYTEPLEPQISGSNEERFKEIMKDLASDKESV